MYLFLVSDFSAVGVEKMLVLEMLVLFTVLRRAEIAYLVSDVRLLGHLLS